MTNVLLAGFTSHWHRRKSSMRTTGEEPTSATRLSAASRAFGAECENNPAQFQRGLKINKNSAEGEGFFVDFPSYRTFQGLRIDVKTIDGSFGEASSHAQAVPFAAAHKQSRWNEN